MILFCSNTAWSMYNFRKGLLQKLIADGIKVSILAPEDFTSQKLRDMGCEVIHLPMQQKGVNPFADLKLIISIYNVFRTLRPEFVFLYTIKPNIYGSIAAAMAGIPCVAITTGLGYAFIKNNWVSRVAKALYSFSFRFPKEIWFLNGDDKSIFISQKLVKDTKAKRLPGEGVDTDYFSPSPIVSSLGGFRFLLIARMLWDKGIAEYVEAARIVRARYPSVQFQLLGACDSPNPSAISKAQIMAWQEEGVSLYLGTVEDVRQCIAAADCVVLPSYREGIPRSLLEASSMARPIITTDAPGCRDVVKHGETGLLCIAQNSQSLAESCFQMIDMLPAQRKSMGTAGRMFIQEKFDEKLVISYYLNALKTYRII